MFPSSDLWPNLSFITVESVICNTYGGDLEPRTVFHKYFLAPELEILKEKVNQKSDLRESAPAHTSAPVLLKFYGH